MILPQKMIGFNHNGANIICSKMGLPEINLPTLQSQNSAFETLQNPHLQIIPKNSQTFNPLKNGFRDLMTYDFNNDLEKISPILPWLALGVQGSLATFFSHQVGNLPNHFPPGMPLALAASVLCYGVLTDAGRSGFFVFTTLVEGAKRLIYDAKALEEDMDASLNTATKQDILTQKNLLEFKQDLNWAELIQDHPIILLGERHIIDQRHFDDILDHLIELRRAGLTHITLELPYWQAVPLLGAATHSLTELIIAAKALGIQIKAIDKGHFHKKGSKAQHMSIRNEYMVKEIESILEENPKAKIIMINGTGHLRHDNDPEKISLPEMFAEKHLKVLPLFVYSANRYDQKLYYPEVDIIRSLGLHWDRFLWMTDDHQNGDLGFVNLPESHLVPPYIRSLSKFYRWGPIIKAAFSKE